MKLISRKFYFQILRVLRAVISCAAVFLFCTVLAQAITIGEYKQNIHKAALAFEKMQRDSPVSLNQTAIFRETRLKLPPTQKIGLPNGTDLEVDNRWLEAALNDLEKSGSGSQTQKLQLIAERLGAIEIQLETLEKATAAARSKAEDKQKLEEILRRPEFQKPVKEEDQSVLTRFLHTLYEWWRSLFPKRQPRAEGIEEIDSKPIGTALNYLVIALAVLIIGFVFWRVFLPMFGRNRKRGKKRSEPRIILGETLAADETADDLLSQANLLAQNGDVRLAIRKGYIALLCELNDRSVLGLARHKTNRDYLRDVRKQEQIFQPMRVLTGSFERHWYGDVPADENDWSNFRTKYDETLKN